MWFQRRQRPESKLPIGGELGLATPAGIGIAQATAARPSLRAIDPVPDDDRHAEPKAAPEPPILAATRRRQTRLLPAPRGRLAANLISSPDTPANAYSAYNRLRTQVLQRLQSNNWNTMGIAAIARDSDSTLTAINLAIAIARDYSSTVLLVELDLIKPTLHEILGFDPQHGIVDHLLHDAPLSELLLNPGIDRLVVLPAGAPVTDSSELLTSPKMTKLVEELKQRYDDRIVLFALPPVLLFDDALAFSPLVDCVLLVVEEGESRMSDLRHALETLKSTNVLGVVLNHSAHVQDDGKIVSR